MVTFWDTIKSWRGQHVWHDPQTEAALEEAEEAKNDPEKKRILYERIKNMDKTVAAVLIHSTALCEKGEGQS